MKYFLTSAAALISTPLFAHEGLHMHPHASDPSWLPLIAGTVVVAGLTRLLWARR
ncbi:peptidase M23 [Roseobacter sp.]|uniref:peptidase M23 n=1 Tax=Roseobacter sp. TaxID=1907202 RepID=UPI00329A1C40